MKQTKQKEAILSAVLNNHIHPSAEDIYAILKTDNERLSLGTVYRNLNRFVQKGKIRKVIVPNFSDRFDYRLENHEHLCCEKCGKVFDIDAQLNINDIVPKDNNIILTGYTLMFYGVCNDCAKNIAASDSGIGSA